MVFFVSPDFISPLRKEYFGEVHFRMYGIQGKYRNKIDISSQMW